MSRTRSHFYSKIEDKSRREIGIWSKVGLRAADGTGRSGTPMWMASQPAATTIEQLCFASDRYLGDLGPHRHPRENLPVLTTRISIWSIRRLASSPWRLASMVTRPSLRARSKLISPLRRLANSTSGVGSGERGCSGVIWATLPSS